MTQHTSATTDLTSALTATAVLRPQEVPQTSIPQHGSKPDSTENDPFSASNLRDLLESGKNSDLTIKCGQDLHKVHRVVICPQSKFFDVACNGPFKETTSREIDLSDDDPGTVSRLIKFLYTKDYDDHEVQEAMAIRNFNFEIDKPPGWSQMTKREKKRHLYKTCRVPIGTKGISSPGRLKAKLEARETKQNLNQHRLVNQALVYAISSKYDIPLLKESAKARFDSLLKPPGLPRDFSKLITIVFESTPSSDSGLRQTVLWKAGKLHRWMTKDVQLSTLVSEGGQFAQAFIQQLSQSHATLQKRMKMSIRNLDEELELMHLGTRYTEFYGLKPSGRRNLVSIANLNSQYFCRMYDRASPVQGSTQEGRVFLIDMQERIGRARESIKSAESFLQYWTDEDVESNEPH